jgi:16S rRNA (cytidine1402-2'-O)-methyltransferase
MMNINNLGTLYIVATPIGNLQDITLRAIEILKTVDLIAAEDTRHSASLLQQFAIAKPLLSLHEHNETERIAQLLHQLQKGQSIALISDAGTPLISDPGYLLVRQARMQGIKVEPIPGACAAIAALSASGLPADRFTFEGFLPVKSQARLQRLTPLKSESRTMIFYEAPHRILSLLQDLHKIFGDEREVVLARELTKMFETIRLGKLKEMIEWVESDANQQRGEIVLLVSGSHEKNVEESLSVEVILKELLVELPLKKAVEIAVRLTGEKKNAVYEKALELKADTEPRS